MTTVMNLTRGLGVVFCRVTFAAAACVMFWGFLVALAAVGAKRALCREPLPPAVDDDL